MEHHSYRSMPAEYNTYAESERPPITSRLWSSTYQDNWKVSRYVRNRENISPSQYMRRTATVVEQTKIRDIILTCSNTGDDTHDSPYMRSIIGNDRELNVFFGPFESTFLVTNIYNEVTGSNAYANVTHSNDKTFYENQIEDVVQLPISDENTLQSDSDDSKCILLRNDGRCPTRSPTHIYFLQRAKSVFLCINKLTEEALDKFCTLIEVFSYALHSQQIVVVYVHDRKSHNEARLKLQKEINWCREIILSANSQHNILRVLEQSVTFVKFSECDSGSESAYRFAAEDIATLRGHTRSRQTVNVSSNETIDIDFVNKCQEVALTASDPYLNLNRGELRLIVAGGAALVAVVGLTYLIWRKRNCIFSLP